MTQDESILSFLQLLLQQDDDGDFSWGPEERDCWLLDDDASMTQVCDSREKSRRLVDQMKDGRERERERI